MLENKEVNTDNEVIQFDGMFKEIMGELSERNLVQFVNAIFGKDFPLDSKVIRLETESNKTEDDDKVKTRRSDIMLDIDGYMFNIEVQSSGDSSMVLRMFEYGYRAALTHNKSVDDNCLELRFPDPVVIYLRSGAQTPTELKIKVIFPNIDHVEYKIPTKRIGDYTPEVLFDNSLYPIAMFYPMKFEKDLLGKHDAEVERRFMESFAKVAEMYKAKEADGEISKKSFILCLYDMHKITKIIIDRAKIINREEVDKFMENVQTRYVSEPIKWWNQGKAEERLEIAAKMIAKQCNMDLIIEITELDEETIKRLQKENADKVKQTPEEKTPAKKRVIEEREER